MGKRTYKGMWKSFFGMLKKSKLPYALMISALIFNTINAWIGLKLPEFIAGLVNEVTRENTLTIFWFGILSILTGGIAVTCKMLATYKINRNMQKIAVDKIFYLRMDEIEKSDPREMVTRVTTDTKLLSELLLIIAIDELPRIYYMVGALTTIYNNHSTTLGNIMLVSIPVTLLGSFVTGKLTFGKADAAQAAISRLTARLAEKINNMPTIKSYNSQKKEEEAGHRVIKDLEYNLKQKALIDRINPAMTSLATLIPTVVVIAIGATMVLSESLEVTSFVAYYGLAGTFIGYVVAHMTLWISIKNGQGATYRLSQILEKEDEIVIEKKRGSLGDIEFKGVSKKFGDNLVLDNVSFTLEQGQKTALVGFSGSGKSTVLNLIEQFYRPTSGVITMGGEDITNWDISSYRKNFTYVPQNAPGFSGTIRELVNFGRKNPLSDEIIWNLLERVDAKAFVELLGGLDYEVGSNAEKLSGGQKQKLCLARAMVEPKGIMLLDEATSALDYEASKKIQKLLDETMKNKTMILVAHHISTIKNADKIIVFDAGRIIAQGTHQTLLDGCELYRSFAISEEGGVQA